MIFIIKITITEDRLSQCSMYWVKNLARDKYTKDKKITYRHMRRYLFMYWFIFESLIPQTLKGLLHGLQGLLHVIDNYVNGIKEEEEGLFSFTFTANNRYSYSKNCKLVYLIFLHYLI